MANYLYTDLTDQVVDTKRYPGIYGIITVRNILNRAARQVISDLDLRSTKRKTALTSKLFDDEYSYPSPSDLKDNAFIDVAEQGLNRTFGKYVTLTTEERFDRRKIAPGQKQYIALATDDLTHRLLFSGDVDDTVLNVAEFGSTTGDGGTWIAYGDATNVAQNTNRSISGNSVGFDLTGAGTTAGLSNIGLTTFDITDYITDGSVFVWVYINSTTNLTNWILTIGNDITANYYTQTITTQADGTAFVNGWNLLRFDFASMTQTGTVTPTTCDSVAIYMTKTSGKADDGYVIDSLSLHTGQYHDVLYYSKFPWQNSSGTFIENSTADTDYLNCDTDEFDLFVYKGKKEIFGELKEFDLMKLAEEEYQRKRMSYRLKNPSERLRYDIRSYYNVRYNFR